jgi:hypothetical protein
LDKTAKIMYFIRVFNPYTQKKGIIYL